MRATRKPLLLFRLSVVFLLRFAERRFLGSLFQEPPRRSRLRQGDGQASEQDRRPHPGRSRGAGARCWPAPHEQSRHRRGAGSPPWRRSRFAFGHADHADGCGSAVCYPRVGDDNRPSAAHSPGRLPVRLSRIQMSLSDGAAGAALPDNTRSGPASRSRPPGRHGTARSRPRSADNPWPVAPPWRNDRGRRDKGWRRTGWSGSRWAAPAAFARARRDRHPDNDD